MDGLAEFMRQNPHPTPKQLEEYEKKVTAKKEQRRKKLQN